MRPRNPSTFEDKKLGWKMYEVTRYSSTDLEIQGPSQNGGRHTCVGEHKCQLSSAQQCDSKSMMVYGGGPWVSNPWPDKEIYPTKDKHEMHVE